MRAKTDEPTDQQAPDAPQDAPAKQDAPKAETPKDEPFKRPDALYFAGRRNAAGEPVEHLAGYGIDARDYEKGDPALARLSDEQIALALDSKLYRRTKPAATQE